MKEQFISIGKDALKMHVFGVGTNSVLTIGNIFRSFTVHQVMIINNKKKSLDVWKVKTGLLCGSEGGRRQQGVSHHLEFEKSCCTMKVQFILENERFFQPPLKS